VGIVERAIDPNDSFSPARALFRKLVHLCSYHFILKRDRTTSTRVAGLDLTVLPSVFHPKVFVTSGFFADFLQSLDLAGKSVVEIGTGSGVLALSAAKAGARSVLALDINPAAVKAAQLNAARNGLSQVTALESNLFSAVPADAQFDVIISSPPSFSGEPRDTADRAWHAGPGYRDIVPLFTQAAPRLTPDGRMYLLLSSDTNLALFDSLIAEAGFTSQRIATRSIWVEAFYLYELRLRSEALAGAAS
jgi:methylase of polypeptide subunit release factors